MLTISAPTTPYASVAHGDFKYVGYTGVYNVVDYSATSFPSGVFVDKAKDKPATDVKVQSEYCKATRDSCESAVETTPRRMLIFDRQRGAVARPSCQFTVGAPSPGGHVR
jgi:hypothetical protein